jgi:hypothetical protein
MPFVFLGGDSFWILRKIVCQIDFFIRLIAIVVRDHESFFSRPHKDSHSSGPSNKFTAVNCTSYRGNLLNLPR